MTDLEEFNLGFRNALNVNPTLADTDGDQLTDGEEIAGSGSRAPTDPTVADTDGDTLSDGVESNTRRYVDSSDTGTNPLASDTDRDGYEDQVETNTGTFISESNPGTNPNVFDTDGDGLNDHEEVFPDPVLFFTPTNPTLRDTDGDSSGDLLENIWFTDPLNPDSAPPPVPFGEVFLWDDWSIGIDHPGGSETYLNTMDPVDLLVGQALTFAFDITGHDNGDSDHLDVRLGFGSSFTNPGYWNPSIDVGPPGGTTAVIRYRNDNESNAGSNVDNIVVVNTDEIPSGGGIVDSVTENHIEFTVARSDSGFETRLIWDDVVLRGPTISTGTGFISSPIWENVHIRLSVDGDDVMTVRNIRMTYEELVLPPVVTVTAIELVAPTIERDQNGAQLTLAWNSAPGAQYQIQVSDDLINWEILESNYPADGATGETTSYTVTLTADPVAARFYRVVFAP